MAGPGVPEGRQSDAFCYLLDIYPTLCELVGLPLPNTVEGQSLVSALRDADAKIRDTLLFAYRGVQRAVQDRQYKLIETVVDGQRTTQLFDRQADPWELANLVGDAAHADRVTAMRKALLRWRDELDDAQPGQGELFWRGYDA
jgi:arylsulfatase A-like enzyme